MDAKKLVDNNLIYECISGSIAYGLSTPESDVDTRGIFIPPKSVALNPFEKIEHYNDSTRDRQIMSLTKFLTLASNCNPNIIELLFIDPTFVKHKHPVMDILLNNRDLFVTRKAKHTFSGYAVSQLKRIKGHNKHLDNPQPKEHPSIVNYLKWISPSGRVTMVKDVIAAKEALTKCVGVKINSHLYVVYQLQPSADLNFPFLVHTNDPHNLHPIDTEDQWDRFNNNKHLFHCLGTVTFALEEYYNDTKTWENYWEWKNNRNEKRSRLENDYGYDTKHAMHLIRLLKMGKEILSGDGVKVHRTSDRQELMDIRNGSMSYEDLTSMADSMLGEINSISSNLPRAVNLKRIADIHETMLTAYWDSLMSGDAKKERPSISSRVRGLIGRVLPSLKGNV